MKKVLFLFAILFPFGAKATTNREIGDAMRFALPMYAMGMAVREQEYDGVLQLTYSLLGSQASVEILKKASQEKRPDWEPGHKKDSFPSGHSAAAFSGATFVHKRYGLKQAAVPYVLATYTAWTRVDAERHYWRDVAAGAAVSALWTWAIVDEYPGIGVSVSPSGASVSYTKQF